MIEDDEKLKQANQLASKNIGLAHDFVSRNRNWAKDVLKLDYDDLFSAAMYGLVVASRKFNPALGFTFGTFAFTCMKTQMVNVSRKGRKRPFEIYSFYERDGKQADHGDYGRQSARMEMSADLSLLPACLERLDQRTRDIIVDRLSGLTLGTIGAKHGVSRERIRQIYKHGIALCRRRVGRMEL